MTCRGVSDILHHGGTRGENSSSVCTSLSLLYAPVVTLHVTLITLTVMMFTGTSDSCQIFGTKTRVGENPNNEPTLFGFVKSTKNEQYSSLFMVLLARSTSGYLSLSSMSLLPRVRGYRSSNRCFKCLAIASNS